LVKRVYKEIVETIEIEITSRAGIGSSDSRRLRKAGIIPGVVYSPGKGSTSVTLNRHAFVMSARGKAHTQIFKFIGDTELSGKLSLVKDVSIEPIKGEVIHVEFLAVDSDHKVVVNVSVKVEGIPECVKLGTATVNQTTYEIALECFPTAIPEAIILDISSLEAGDSFHASDIKLPANCALKSAPGLTIVTATVDKKAKEVETVVAAAPVAAKGAPAAKAAPAAGKAAPKPPAAKK
jgi:large subunit ribosomal protein L25